MFNHRTTVIRLSYNYVRTITVKRIRYYSTPDRRACLYRAIGQQIGIPIDSDTTYTYPDGIIIRIIRVSTPRRVNTYHDTDQFRDRPGCTPFMEIILVK